VSDKASADDLEREADWTPNFPRLRLLDAKWYRAERLLCGLMFLAMALMVMAAVVTDIFGARRSPFDVVILFGVVWLAIRTRTVREDETAMPPVKMLGVAAGVTIAIAGAVCLYTEQFPSGFVWAQKLALVAMLWVSLLGASLATYERAHLALEMGEKLWPKRMLHMVRAAAHGVTSAFCIALLFLSLRLVADQRGWKATIEANDWLPSWVAIAILPYAFLAMSVRFLAQTVTLATRTDKPKDEQVPT